MLSVRLARVTEIKEMHYNKVLSWNTVFFQSLVHKIWCVSRTSFRLTASSSLHNVVGCN